MKKIVFIFIVLTIIYFCIQVNADTVQLQLYGGQSEDDGQEATGGEGCVNTNYTYVELQAGFPWYRWGGAYRIPNLTIPKGATINSAYISLHGWGGIYNHVIVEIASEDADNATVIQSGCTYNGHGFDLSERWNRRTTALVSWDEEFANPYIRHSTPELKTLIQEIVNRDNWQSGNAIMFLFKCLSGSTFETYTWDIGTDTYKPILYVNYTANGSDTTPPVRNNGQPSGTLPAGTTQTTVSLTTNENATCKYSMSPGISYSSMSNAFSTTGGTTHSTLVTGLQNGNIYNYYVKCIDQAGNANTDDYLISFSVALPDTNPPTASITSPANGSTVSGTITITANASDNNAVAGVQFKIDGNNTGTEDTTSPYSTNWNTNTTSNGNHTLTATARDYAGNTTTSNPVTVNVNNIFGDTTPPGNVTDLNVFSVTFNSIFLKWTAPGDDGNIGTAFQYDLRYSTSVINSSNWSSAVQVSGEPVPLAAGTVQSITVNNLNPSTTYYFALKTVDDNSNWSDLSNVPNGTTTAAVDSIPPTVNIDFPLDGAVVSGTITITASASDNNAVAGVQFKVDGNNLGTEDSITPYSVSWNTGLVSNGDHNLTVVARDYANNTTTSTPITVDVNNACISDWNCSEWTQCLNETQNRTCNDLNYCDANNYTITETRACGDCNASQTRSCTIESCAGTQTCTDQNIWGSCTKNDSCCGITCNDSNDCTTDSCSNGSCIFTPISGCGGSPGGNGGGGGGGGGSQYNFTIKTPDYLIDGKEFTITILRKGTSIPVNNATAEYAKQKKATDSNGTVSFTAKLNETSITVTKQGFITETIQVIIEPTGTSLCGNNVCDTTETIESCPQDCLTEVPKEITLKIIISEELIEGKTFEVKVVDGKGNPVKDVRIKYGLLERTTNEKGITLFTARKNLTNIIALKEGYKTQKQEIKTIKETPKSSCGNNVCDTEESPSVCPQDCPLKTNELNWTAIITATIITLIIISIVMFEIKKKKRSVIQSAPQS